MSPKGESVKCSLFQDQPSTMSGSWVTPWSGSGPCCWHRWWCLGTSGSSETCSNQLSMVKNLYLDTKINLLWCQGAELHNFPNIRVSGTFPGLPSHFWRSSDIKKVAPNLVSCRSRCIEAISIRKSCLQDNFLPPPYNSLCYVGYPAKVNVEFRTQIMRKRFLAEGGGYFEDKGTIL